MLKLKYINKILYFNKVNPLYRGQCMYLELEPVLISDSS